MVAGDACDGDTPAAWITPVTSPIAGRRLDQGVNRLALGDVDGGGADRKPGVVQDLRGRLGGLRAKVGQQDVLAGADATGDCLTDRSGADDDDDTRHA